MIIKQALIVSGLALSAAFIPTLPVLSQVSLSCTVSTVGINFGTYDVFSTLPKDATGQVTYKCLEGSLLQPITISLSKGNSTTYIPRQMQKGSALLNYNLYLDAAGQSIWGDGTGGTNRYSSNLLTGTVIIYGRIPARQNVSAGTYADSITATLNF
ncbi:spore coat U domain-containing protein [Chroococcidiopsis sp. CCMEE 29]|uniref:Csu type fimbrial protein n=1 Tax=Chroococcidiopsis sp. CCMEE 29 TaxID=155894 RepID=UPI0020212226|nr:spore coat U domain-containing protein [Chroococcidiopsis sp. CCMEE 29]